MRKTGKRPSPQDQVDMSEANEAPPSSPPSAVDGTKDEEAISDANDPLSPNSLPPAYDGHEYQIASLAATLVAGTFRESFSSRSEDMSHPRHDDLYYGALKRAQWMLEKSSNPDDDVHAYQVFQEGDVYSAQEIADEFDLIKWKGNSRNAVQPWLTVFQKRLESLPAELAVDPDKSFVATCEEATQKIRSSLKNLEDDETVQAAFRAFGQKSDQFLRSLQRRQYGRYGVAAMIDNKWHGLFLEWCFPCDEKGQKYRPHEIFRIAAMLGDDRVRLIQTRANLRRGFIPHPSKDLENFSFNFFTRSLLGQELSD